METPAGRWNRSSNRETSWSKGILKNFSKFTRKHPFLSLFFNKVAGLNIGFYKISPWLLLLSPNLQFLIMLIVTYVIFQLFLFHPQWWILFFPPNLLNTRHLWKPTLPTGWYFILFFGYFIFYLLSIYGLWSIADVEQDSGLTYFLLRF